MYKILAVSGSPRRGGNTELLLQAALEPFSREGHSIDKFYMSDKQVAPCLACDACADDGRCVIKDDMAGFVRNLPSYDAIIIGSPVYNRNISAQLAAVFNRLHCIFYKRPFRDRICFGGAIAVGGSPNSQGITLNIIHNFLLSLGSAASLAY